MKPWILLESADIPGGGTMGLYQRDGDFSIRVGRDELMCNRMHGSEEALAELAIARLHDAARARVLVGGLGMGFTLAAALRTLGPDARVVVAELVPAVVAWNRGPLAALAGAPLEDPRVRVDIADVADVLDAHDGDLDLVLLDVDNGPQGMTAAANDRLYGARGLERIRSALRPGGMLAVWSAGADERFTARLRRAGFSAETISVRARGRRGARHVIWLARRRERR